MTVQELIDVLSRIDRGLPVLLPGYEGGYVDLMTVAPAQVSLNVHAERYYGPGEEVRQGDRAGAVRAVILSGRR